MSATSDALFLIVLHRQAHARASSTIECERNSFGSGHAGQGRSSPRAASRGAHNSLAHDNVSGRRFRHAPESSDLVLVCTWKTIPLRRLQLRIFEICRHWLTLL